MKNLLALFILILFNFGLYAQVEPKYLDSKYQETVKRKATYKMISSSISDTVLENVYFLRGGKLDVKFKYHISTPEMIFAQYLTDLGAISYEGWLRNKKKTGDWTYYFLGKRIKTFENGKEIYYKSYFTNGLLRKEVELQNNNFHGLCKEYSKQGILLSERNYYNGVKQGKIVKYTDNGTKSSSFFLLNNQQHGPDSSFKDGKLDKIMNYEKGHRNGRVYYFNEDSIFKNAYYRNDTLYGGPPEKLAVQRDPIRTCDQVMPQFKGGEAAMYRFISENILYPEEAREAGIEGRVYINFIVRSDGTLSDVDYIGNDVLGFGCERECIELIELMPDWDPALQDGIPVKVYFTLPIRFQLF